MAEAVPGPRQRVWVRRHRLASPDAVLTLHRPGPGVVVVSAEGEIDLANRDALAAALRQVSTEPVVRLLVCDLSATTFLACSGLAVLLDTKAELARRGAVLRVVTDDPTVLRVLDATGQREVLDVRPELDDALTQPGPAVARHDPAGDRGGDLSGDLVGEPGTEPATPGSLAGLNTALASAVAQTTELAATWGRLADQLSALDADRLVDGRGGHWKPRETLAEMAEDLRVLQNHLATGALLAAPTVEDLSHLRVE
jgi:anti-anti-sigma factor